MPASSVSFSFHKAFGILMRFWLLSHVFLKNGAVGLSCTQLTSQQSYLSSIKKVHTQSLRQNSISSHLTSLQSLKFRSPSKRQLQNTAVINSFAQLKEAWPWTSLQVHQRCMLKCSRVCLQLQTCFHEVKISPCTFAGWRTYMLVSILLLQGRVFLPMPLPSDAKPCLYSFFPPRFVFLFRFQQLKSKQGNFSKT